MYETYFHSTTTAAKIWSDEKNGDLKTPIHKGQRVIDLHAGGESKFVSLTALKMFKSGSKTQLSWSNKF